MMLNNNLVGGIPTPLKNMKVTWDDEIPNMMGKIKAMFPTTNQSIYPFGTSSRMRARYEKDGVTMKLSTSSNDASTHQVTWYTMLPLTAPQNFSLQNFQLILGTISRSC